MEPEEQLLEEYKSIRSEIQQLNGEAFTIVTGSLTANLALLGVAHAAHPPVRSRSQYLAFFALFIGTVFIAHKIRMAHRLGLFLKIFVQPNLEGIQWPGVYFSYRLLFDAQRSSKYELLLERFANVQTAVLFGFQILNLVVLVLWSEAFALATFGLALLVWEVSLVNAIGDYKRIEATLTQVAKIPKKYL
jgi:hypothetical protein